MLPAEPVAIPRPAPVVSDGSTCPNGPAAGSFRPFWIFTAILVVAFSPVLYKLLRYSLSVDLYSHIFLIPAISGYLIWQKRKELPEPGRGSLPLALLAATVGAAILAGFLFLRGPQVSLNDFLTWTVLPFYFLFLAGALFFLGTPFIKAILFPLAFGIFIVPFPDAVAAALEIASQTASAEVYSWMMYLTGATYYREGQNFMLPGLIIEVAQECSGIRSSFVLFLTSLLAGYMFLRTTWKRALLAFIVIPLGFVRNAFRVYVISMLTAHVAPWVIDSPLHHRGGPLFFALSLIPFFALLLWLKKSDRTKATASSQS